MSKRLKNINLNGNLKERVLIVGHNDLDGVMSSFIAHLAYRSMGYDTMIYYDISSNKAKTDEMIRDGFEAIGNLSLGDFKEICIVDRESCTIEKMDWLDKKGIPVVHIDHHQTNRPLSRLIESKISRFTSVFELGDDYIYSATYLTYKYFEDFLKKNVKYVDLLYTYTVMADLYDTFKWTEVPMDADVYLKTLYKVDSEWLSKHSRCLPLDVSSVNLNYLFKFMDGEMFLDEITKSIESGSDLMDNCDVIIKKFKQTEDANYNFINYAYRDAKSGRLGLYTPEIYDLTYTESNVARNAEVLFVDKPLDYDTSSVSAYRFLKDNPNVILIYRTKETSYSYSVRSTGDINTLAISTQLNGGGHKNASGFTIQEEKDLVLEFQRQNKERIKSKLEQTIDSITLDSVF